MATAFSRTLSLLRQEKGVSQRSAAKELGISQALLSHYENGIREPGLAFVLRACEYYRVSADFMLGRTLSRDGSMIASEDVYDASGEKGTLKGSILATLQKKLIINAVSLLFDLLGKVGSREAISAAAASLSVPIYRLFRRLYCAGGENESLFALSRTAFSADAEEAAARLADARYLAALCAHAEAKGEFPPMDDQTLAQSYPGLFQSASQVLHNVDEETNAILTSR
ncbi:MAG: helix-turn-helix transcriptional regulator [Oscillospiraceae bacterium]|nr:helix-turn-helix transcriptional regulator [Oscillospiraceae bacterium]